MSPRTNLSLTVYFDLDCVLCRNVARWLAAEPTYVPLELRPAQAERSTGHCPVDPDTLLDELTLVASDGGVYRGAKAFLMCLWATRRYRGWSLRLSGEAGLPWARRLYGMIARLGRVTRREPGRSEDR